MPLLWFNCIANTLLELINKELDVLDVSVVVKLEGAADGFTKLSLGVPHTIPNLFSTFSSIFTMMASTNTSCGWWSNSWMTRFKLLNIDRGACITIALSLSSACTEISPLPPNAVELVLALLFFPSLVADCAALLMPDAIFANIGANFFADK